MTSSERRALVKAIKSILLSFAIEALRAGTAGNRQDALHLAETLEAMRRNPEQTPKILGIKRSRGRPRALVRSRAEGNQFAEIFTIPTLLSLGLDLTVAKYLSRAFRIALRNPPIAGKAFGIDRDRGRGVWDSQARYRKLALDVYALKSFRCSMTESRKDKGILERVAELRHVSVDTVQRAWDAYREILSLMDQHVVINDCAADVRK